MIALGTRVAYHHRDAVARWRNRTVTGFENEASGGWELREGVGKNEYVNPAHGYEFSMDHLADLFCDWPRPLMPNSSQNRVNKTVMVWPEEGSGIVTGQVRRGRGMSVGSSGGGGGLFGDDYEPGYFDPDCYFDLYAVRHELKGTSYILVPTWAVRPT